MDYVRPPAFFAHRVIRVMTKTCACHDIGMEGFSLVAMIGHQWDVIRYARPVAYHLSVLMNLLGIKHKTAFYRIERRCQEYGWLGKEIRGRRQQSLYWVAIPKRHENVQDGATEDQDVSLTSDGIVSQSVSPNTPHLCTKVCPKPCPKVCPPTSLSLSLPLDPSPTSGGLLDGTPSAEPIDPEQHWPYVRCEQWVKDLVKAGSGINKSNWLRWQGLGERFTFPAMLATAQGLPSTDRTPWTVEAVLEELAAVKPKGQRLAIVAPNPVLEKANAIADRIGWEEARKRLECADAIRSEGDLRDAMRENPELAADLVASEERRA